MRAVVRGGAGRRWRETRGMWRRRRVQQVSQDDAPLAASSCSGGAPVRARRRGSHWRERLHTRVRTQTRARRHTSLRLRLNPCRTHPETVTFTALLLFNFLFLHSLPHTRTHTLSILNSQAPVNQSELIAFAFLKTRCVSAGVSTTCC